MKNACHVLPGLPLSHALSSANWRGLPIIAYLTADSLLILTGPADLCQSIAVKNPLSVSVDPSSGRIALVTTDHLALYEPSCRVLSEVQWIPSCSVPIESSSLPPSLSFGDQELLLAGTALSLFQLNGALLWQAGLPTPTYCAQISPCSNLIASVGLNDRRVKIWRRQASDRFDFSYLPHPAPVTALRWQAARTPHREHVIDDVLYTMCIDGEVRIWAASTPHALQPLGLRSTLDTATAIQTRQGGHSQRKVFIMDGTQLLQSTLSADLEHLMPVVQKGLDVVVVVDSHGSLSAWAVDTELYNVAHLERFLTTSPDLFEHIGDYSMTSFKYGDSWVFLLYGLSIAWIQGSLDSFFDPRPQRSSPTLQAMWTGFRHISGIQVFNRQLHVYGSGIWQMQDVMLQTQSFENIISSCYSAPWTVLVYPDSIELRSENGKSRSRDIQLGKLRYVGIIEKCVVLVNHNTVRMWQLNESFTLLRTLDLETQLVARIPGKGSFLSCEDGTICKWTGSWSRGASFQSGVEARIMKAGPCHKLALVDESRLFIFDTSTYFLELERDIPGIVNLSWAESPLLAVAQASRVHVLTLSLDSRWFLLYSIELRGLLSPALDVAWTNDGLIVATQNQITCLSDTCSVGETTASMRFFNQYHNLPLPVYHPKMLAYLVQADEVQKAESVVGHLTEMIKFYVPGDPLQTKMLDKYIGSWDVTMEQELEVELPNFSFAKELRRQIHALMMLKKQTALDVCGRNFYFSLLTTPDLWLDVLWASQSQKQDILSDLVQRQYAGRICWDDVRRHGMAFWLSPDALSQLLDLVARNEYNKTDDRNPTDCSLFYLALKKKSVLVGLWRMSTGNKEQAGTLRMLKNDFSEPRWRTAALKNAFALLGKRRFAADPEYAAAWFLLANKLQDAVNICRTQLNDIQLAIAIARVYEGDQGPVFRDLLQQNLLPLAVTTRNRCLAVWTLDQLGPHAAQAFIKPLHELVDADLAPLTNTPANNPVLIEIYRHSSHRLPPAQEWDLLMFAIRQYLAQGLPLAALHLAQHWDFARAQVQSPRSEVQRVIRSEPKVFSEPASSSILDAFGF